MQFRPLQIVHGFSYDKSMTVDESLAAVRDRLVFLKDAGFGGIVCNVSFDDYLVSGHYWEVFEKTVELCARMGLRVWLYDEEGYPSGGARTLVLDGHPEYEARALACVALKVKAGEPVRFEKPVGHDEVMSAFFVEGDCLSDEAFSARTPLMPYVKMDGGLIWTAEKAGKIFYLVTKPAFEGMHPVHNYHDVRRYPDVLNRAAMRRFIEVTHERYAEHVGAYFGGTIEAFFTDEPSVLSFYCPPIPVSVRTVDEPNPDMPLYPFVVWSEDGLLDALLARWGGDARDALALLFECAPDSDRARRFRLLYHEIVAEMYEEAYFKPIRAFCDAHGIASSGHLLMEENIIGEVAAEEDYFRMLRNMTIPGIDMLNSIASDIAGALVCPKLVSSIAHQYGYGGVMSESSCHTQRMAGGTVTFEDMLAAAATQYALGVNVITSYYADDQLPPGEYRLFNDFVARVGECAALGRHAAQVALYYPIHTARMNLKPSDQDFSHWMFPGNGKEPNRPLPEDLLACHRSFDGAARGLMSAQLDFDIVNDEGLQMAECEGRELVNRQGERYRALYVPFARAMPIETLIRLNTFADLGLPIWIDCPGGMLATEARYQEQASRLYAALLAKPSVKSGEGIDAFLIDGEFIGPRDVLASGEGAERLLCLHRTSPDIDNYLLVNTGREAIDLSIAFSARGTAWLIDPLDGGKTELARTPDIRIAFAPQKTYVVQIVRAQ